MRAIFFFLLSLPIFLDIASPTLVYGAEKTSSSALNEKDSQLAEKIIKKIDELFRADSSEVDVEMLIETPHWKRSMKMRMWSLGKDKSFVRILHPKKDKGIATLRIKKDMWNYFPKAKRVICVPPSMMMASWMGSDFTNDDMVRESSLLDDYRASATLDKDKKTYHISLKAKASTASLWQTIVVIVDSKSLMPIEQQYFDEKGVLIRKMTFSDIKEYSGRKIPATLELLPLNKKGHKTVVKYLDAKFNKPLDESVFSQQNLRRKTL